jgi:predicted DsbA family dithiol-disulfide isomerase
MKIQIFIDTVCGWCFIGSQRLISSIQELNKDFEIIYVPFQLNPDMPKQGMDRAVYVQKKFGSLENAKPMYDNMVLEAQKENLQFNLSLIIKTPNTVASHILIDLARKERVQKEVVYDIFSDYFEKGIDIGDENNLVKVGVKHGIDEDILKKELRSLENINKVSKMDGIGRKMGITGVPFYIFNEKILLSGAQRSEAIFKAIEEAQ